MKLHDYAFIINVLCKCILIISIRPLRNELFVAKLKENIFQIVTDVISKSTISYELYLILNQNHGKYGFNGGHDKTTEIT